MILFLFCPKLSLVGRRPSQIGQLLFIYFGPFVVILFFLFCFPRFSLLFVCVSNHC